MILRYICRVIAKNEEQFKALLRIYPINQISRVGRHIAAESLKIIDISYIYARSKGIHRSKQLLKWMGSRMTEEFNIAKEEHRRSTDKHILYGLLSKNIKYAFIDVYRESPVYNTKISKKFLFEPGSIAPFIYRRKLYRKNGAWKHKWSIPLNKIVPHIIHKLRRIYQKYLPAKLEKSSKTTPVPICKQYEQNPAVNSRLLITPTYMKYILSPFVAVNNGMCYNIPELKQTPSHRNKIPEGFLPKQIELLNNYNRLLPKKNTENFVFDNMKLSNLETESTNKPMQVLVIDQIAKPDLSAKEMDFNRYRYKHYNIEQYTIGHESSLYRKGKEEQDIQESGMLPVIFLSQKWNRWYQLPGFESVEGLLSISEFSKKLILQRKNNYSCSEVNSPQINYVDDIKHTDPKLSSELFLPDQRNINISSNTKTLHETSKYRAKNPKYLEYSNPLSCLGITFPQKIDKKTDIANPPLVEKAPNDVRYIRPDSSLVLHATSKEDEISELKPPEVTSDVNEIISNSVRCAPESSGLYSSQAEDNLRSDVKSTARIPDAKEMIRTDEDKDANPECSSALHSSQREHVHSNAKEIKFNVVAYIRPPSSLSLHSSKKEDEVGSIIKPSQVISDSKRLIDNENHVRPESPLDIRHSQQKEDNTSSDKQHHIDSTDMSRFEKPVSSLVLHFEPESAIVEKSNRLKSDLSLYFIKIRLEQPQDELTDSRISEEHQDPQQEKLNTDQCKKVNNSTNVLQSIPMKLAENKLSESDNITNTSQCVEIKNQSVPNKLDKTSASFWPDNWWNPTCQINFEDTHTSDPTNATNSSKHVKNKNSNDENKS